MAEVKFHIRKLGTIPSAIANGEIVYVKDGPIVQQWIGDINGQSILVGTTLRSASVSFYQPQSDEYATLLYTPYPITITKLIGGIYNTGNADVNLFATNDLNDLQQIPLAQVSLDSSQAPNVAQDFNIVQGKIQQNYFIVVHIVNAVQSSQINELFVQMDYSFQNL